MIKFNWKRLLFSFLLSLLSSLVLVKGIGWEYYFWVVILQTNMSAVLILIQQNFKY